MVYPIEIIVRPGNPDFLDLPWGAPLSEWADHCTRLEQVPRGLSRHPVLFVNYDAVLYALKEMAPGAAEQEYELLRQAEEANLPAVSPVGHVLTATSQGNASVLVTRYLESSLPYRMLFMSQGLERYRQYLLDAIAGLLVQLHLTGLFWGDCSLSNTLFRRDAGALQAYLVDAETAEIHTGYFPPALRFHDLQIMEENLESEFGELHDSGMLSMIDMAIPVLEAGIYIQRRYQQLWEEITRDDVINPGEHFRIQERIRALNDLGFSVGDVELASLENGSQLRLRVITTDRYFHKDQIYDLTGLDMEERQARTMMNEIQELRATLSQSSNRNIPLNAAAYHWLANIYQPVVERLKPLIDQNMTIAELYCQVLEHKWYLSERAQRDVGHQAAVEDYLGRFGANLGPGSAKVLG
jgi:hypothetical protein